MRYEVQVQIKSFLNELLFRAYHVSEDDIIKPSDDVNSESFKKKAADVLRKQKQIKEINYLLKNRDSAAIENFIKSDIFLTPAEKELKCFILYLVKEDPKYLVGINDKSKLNGLNLGAKYDPDFVAAFDVETLIDEDNKLVNETYLNYYKQYYRYTSQIKSPTRDHNQLDILHNQLKSSQPKFFDSTIESDGVRAEAHDIDLYDQIVHEESPEIALSSSTCSVKRLGNANHIIDQNILNCFNHAKKHKEFTQLYFEVEPGAWVLLTITPEPEKKVYCINPTNIEIDRSQISNFLSRINDINPGYVDLSEAIEYRQISNPVSYDKSHISVVEIARSISQDVILQKSGFKPQSITRYNLDKAINDKVLHYAQRNAALQIIDEFLQYDFEDSDILESNIEALFYNMLLYEKYLNVEPDKIFSTTIDHNLKMSLVDNNSRPTLNNFFSHIKAFIQKKITISGLDQGLIQEAKEIYENIAKKLVNENSSDASFSESSLHKSLEDKLDLAQPKIDRRRQKHNKGGELDYKIIKLQNFTPGSTNEVLENSLINAAAEKFYANTKNSRKIDHYDFEVKDDKVTLRLHSKVKSDPIAEKEEFEYKTVQLDENSPFTAVEYKLSEEEQKELKDKTGREETTGLKLEFKKGSKGQGNHKANTMLYYYLGSMMQNQVDRLCVIYKDLLETDFNDRKERLNQAELDFVQLKKDCFGDDPVDYSQPISSILSVRIGQLQKTIDDKNNLASEEEKSAAGPAAIDKTREAREELEKLKELKDKYPDNINLDNVRNFLNFIKHQQKSATQKKAGYKIETSKLKEMQNLPSTIVTNVTIEALMKNNQMLTTY